MGRRYNRYSRRYDGAYWAARHASKRDELSRSMGGIDNDIEQIFFNLPSFKLESVFLRYREVHGESALTYARKTYSKWKSGSVQMGGEIAARLINLVPNVLDPQTRFELVKKLRSAHLHKQQKHVTCLPSEWRVKVAPAVAELLIATQKFQLPSHVMARVRWLAEGDAIAAQQLLTAAEQEEAVTRLRYLEAEFSRIDLLIQNIEATQSIRHTIELPQGTITVVITLPRKGLWAWLSELLS